MSAPAGWIQPPPWVPPPLPYGDSPPGEHAVLHPLSPVDILDGAFALIKANARKLFVVVAVFAVPVQLAAAYASRHALGGQSLLTVINDPTLFRSNSQASSGPGTLTRLGLQVLTWIGLAVAGGAISRIVGATYLGQDEPVGAGLRTAWNRAIPLVVASIVVHLAEAGGFAFLLIPGLLAMAASVAVSPAIAIEGLGPMAGVRRSWRLMAPRLWPTVGALLLTGIVASVLGYSIGLLPIAVVALVGLGRYGWLLLALGQTLAVFVSWTLAGSVATLFYFDARIRQEGLDIQILVKGLTHDGDLR